MTEKIPPSKEILSAFGIYAEPVLIAGGQGDSYLASRAVLKPVMSLEEAAWTSELMSKITEDGFRVARPIKTIEGKWIFKDWQAFSFVTGKEAKGRVAEKIAVSRLFHKALAGFEKPSFIAHKTDPWAISDRMIWDDQNLEYSPRLENVMHRLEALKQPINLPSQLIHGDMTGNILFDAILPPAIIDLSPYWRPSEFATAVILVDSIVWDGADMNSLSLVENNSEMTQLLIRAAMWRIKTTEEFMRAYGRGNIDDVDAYLPLIKVLSKRNL